MARQAALKYDESNIKRLRGLEGIRAKPAMYLGELGNPMVFQAMKELIANSIDECLAGRNDYVFVHADPTNNTYIVADKAEGIPVGLVAEDPEKPRGKKVSMLTLIFTEIHTGGKFNDKAYKSSQGTHGVGGSATNAVSESFEVWTHREKKWHYQRFVKGKPVAAVKTVSFPADVKKLLPYMPTRGTVIRFKPDQSVVSTNGGKTKAKLDIAHTARAMRDMAMLNPGIELVLSANGKTKSFVNRDGLIGLVKRRILDLDLETMGKPFVHNSEKLSVAIQWTSYPEDTGLDTYVNSGQTVEHGEHELGFRNALTKALLQYKKKTDKFGPKDQYFGLIGIVNWKMSGAAFSGQTKSKLTSNVSAALEQELLPALTTFFAKNQSLARSIIRRAAAVKKSKDEFTKTLKTMSDAKRKSKNSMPSGLVQAPRASALTRELYIVEGDSAGGCHFSDVMALLADGSTKSFAELVADEQRGIKNQGIAFDLSTGQPEAFEFVEPRIVKTVTEYVEVELADGTVWRGTVDHPWLLTDGTYKAAGDLTPEDDVQEVQHLPNLGQSLGS